jgi:hypothetical protein
MTESHYKQLLLDHAWLHDSIFDPTDAYKERAVLLAYARNHPWFNTLFEHAQSAARAGHPIEPFPTKPGTVAGPSETTTPTPKTMQNEALAALIAALTKPIVDAIDRLTAAQSKTVESGSVSTPAAPAAAATEEEEAPAPAPKRGRKSAEKPAEEKPKAPAPAADDDDDLDTPAAKVTIDDIKTAAKALTEASKERLKTWIKKKYAVEKVAELSPDTYGNVAAAIAKLKAEETPATDEDDV